MRRYISLQLLKVAHVFLLLLFVALYVVFKSNEDDTQEFDRSVKYVSTIVSSCWLTVLFTLKLLSKDSSKFDFVSFYKSLFIKYSFLTISNITFLTLNGLLCYNIVTFRIVEFQSSRYHYNIYKSSIDGTESTFLGSVANAHSLFVKLPNGNNYLIYKNTDFNNLETADIKYIPPYWKDVQPVTHEISSF